MMTAQDCERASERTNTFAEFEAGPLRAIEFAFGRRFDELPSAFDGGVAIKFVLTAHVPVFPAMVAYAILGTDDVVELVGLDVHDEYFDLIEGDPTD